MPNDNTVSRQLSPGASGLADEVNVAAAPFDAQRRAIAAPGRYAATQSLGAAMRAAGVELFRYPSARDREGRVSVGAFTPAVFGGARPKGLETWQCTATRESIDLLKRDYFGSGAHAFARDEFLVKGALPTPAL